MWTKERWHNALIPDVQEIEQEILYQFSFFLSICVRSRDCRPNFWGTWLAENRSAALDSPTVNCFTSLHSTAFRRYETNLLSGTSWFQNSIEDSSSRDPCAIVTLVRVWPARRKSRLPMTSRFGTLSPRVIWEMKCGSAPNDWQTWREAFQQK
jgi:hypothetical protein